MTGKKARRRERETEREIWGDNIAAGENGMG